MNWNLFVTELVAGITHGSVYALIALGYSMVYGILKLLNFAHGDIYMVGAFIGLGLISVFGGPEALADVGIGVGSDPVRRLHHVGVGVVADPALGIRHGSEGSAGRLA